MLGIWRWWLYWDVWLFFPFRNSERRILLLGSLLKELPFANFLKRTCLLLQNEVVLCRWEVLRTCICGLAQVLGREGLKAMRKWSNIIVSCKMFPSYTPEKWSDMMVCSKSDPALLMGSSWLFTGAEVLHGERKQVLLLLPRGFICSGMQPLVAVLGTCLQCHTSVVML